MSSIKAVIFDFIGTLTNVKGYSLETSKAKLYKAIADTGFNVDAKEFQRAYDKAHEKYRIIRYRKLVEVTNAVWISEALNDLGHKTTREDPHVKTAVNVFFEDYLNSLQLRKCVRKMLAKLSTDYKLGLISNFTHAPVIHAGLRKLDINQFFSVVLVSAEVGWRKPHQKIFKQALERLKVSSHETIYVGDSPLEDIKGARATGMKTVFIPSQFYTLEDLCNSQEKTNMIVKNICELSERLPKLLNNNT